MAKKRITKAQNQTFHFKKRCEERLGCQIDRKSIERKIRAQQFDETLYLLNKQSNRVTGYRFKFNNEWYIIPYDKNRYKVITIFKDKNQDIIKEDIVTEVKTVKESVLDRIIKLILEKFKKPTACRFFSR